MAAVKKLVDLLSASCLRCLLVVVVVVRPSSSALDLKQCGDMVAAIAATATAGDLPSEELRAANLAYLDFKEFQRDIHGTTVQIVEAATAVTVVANKVKHTRLVSSQRFD